MITLTHLTGKNFALLGLGISGLATEEALRAAGAACLCADDDMARQEEGAAKGAVIADLNHISWDDIEALIVAPAVPIGFPEVHPLVAVARACAVPVIGDIELFCREMAFRAPELPLIAITGTNGKSTTTALCTDILKGAGFDAFMGGNIGVPALALPDFDKGADSDQIYVLECSSYQIALAPSLRPKIGILLNLFPDHLDRHGGMAEYAGEKQRLVAASQIAIIGVDDDWCRDIADHIRCGGQEVIEISGARELTGGITCIEGQLIDTLPDGGAKRYSLAGINALPGAHNGQNIAACYAVATQFSLSPDRFDKLLSGFSRLKHRLEEVANINGVRFINDSKATNIHAAAGALSSYDNIYWIAGGLAKSECLDDITPFLGNISAAFFIGSAAELFYRLLSDKLPCEICKTLDSAIVAAVAQARLDYGQQAQGSAESAERTKSAKSTKSPGMPPVILFSPACASFDQFKNFAARGDRFRDLVWEISQSQNDMGACHG